MTVTAPPRPRVDAPADVEALEALEALIEEARRRARRRRQRNGAAPLIGGLAAAAAFYGLGNGGDGGGSGAGRAAERPQVGWSPERADEALRNGRLTILGVNGIETVSPTGRVRTLIQCDSLSQQEEPCAAHPWSVDWAPDGRRLAYATAVGPGRCPAAGGSWHSTCTTRSVVHTSGDVSPALRATSTGLPTDRAWPTSARAVST